MNTYLRNLLDKLTWFVLAAALLWFHHFMCLTVHISKVDFEIKRVMRIPEPGICKNA